RAFNNLLSQGGSSFRTEPAREIGKDCSGKPFDIYAVMFVKAYILCSQNSIFYLFGNVVNFNIITPLCSQSRKHFPVNIEQFRSDRVDKQLLVKFGDVFY